MFYIDTNVDTVERYDPKKLMLLDNGFHDIIPSYFFNEIMKLEYAGEYEIGTDQFKPDLISYNIYAKVEYWEILMIYNALFLIEQLTIGTIIKYPSLRQTEQIYFKLQTLERNAR